MGELGIECPVSTIAKNVAKKVSLNLDNFKGEEVARVEIALVKLGLGCCKRNKRSECDRQEFCLEAKGTAYCSLFQ